MQNDSTALAASFDLLARLWLREVDEELLASLGESPIRDAFVAAGGSLVELDSTDADTDPVEALAIDYCQLFIGPGEALSPHQSVWEEGRLEGAAVSSVREFADASGIDLKQAGQVMCDHLGVELWVMGQLLSLLADSENSEEVRVALHEMIRTFQDRHLTWSSSLISKAYDRAETDFYRGVMEMTRELIGTRLESG